MRRKLMAFPAVLLIASQSVSAAVAEQQPTESGAAGAKAAFDTSAGAKLFGNTCAPCHNGGSPKAPNSAFLMMMPQRLILRAMNSGIMAQQASSLSAEQRVQVVEFLTQKKTGSEPDSSQLKRCTGPAAVFDMHSPPLEVGWGHDTSRFVSAVDAGFKASDIPRFRLRWAFAYPGAVRARSQPAIALGALFVGSHDGTVYAFDLKTGCIRWTFEADMEVRTGIVITSWRRDDRAPHEPLLFFGDLLAKTYALNAVTGKLVWARKIDAHPNATITGTPALSGDALYVPVSSLEVAAAVDSSYQCCTFRGKVIALDVSDGRTLWEAFTVPRPAESIGKTAVGTPIRGPSGAPVWNSPAVDSKRGVLYFGSGENYNSPADENSDAVFAVDLRTGDRKWSTQLTQHDAWNAACYSPGHPSCPAESGPDFDVGASVIEIGGGNGRSVLVVGQKSGMVYGLDPDDHGRVVWRTRVGRGGLDSGGIHFGMAAEGRRVYVPISDRDLHDESMNSAPNLESSNMPARPGINALDGMTGQLLWSDIQKDSCGDKRAFCAPGISAAVTAIPGAVFAGHLDGHIRAYNGASGKVIWDFDTTQEIDTLSGRGHGEG